MRGRKPNSEPNVQFKVELPQSLVSEIEMRLNSFRKSESDYGLKRLITIEAFERLFGMEGKWTKRD